MAKKKHTTLSGHAVEFVPVAQYLANQIQLGVEAEYRERGEPIDPPTYTVKVGQDGSETHPHTENSIKKASEEDQTKWAAHLATLEQMRSEQMTKTTYAMLRRGLRFEYREGWEAEQQADGVKVPEGEHDKRIHYILTELLTTPAEVKAAVEQISLQSIDGAPEEVVKALQDSFRG